MSERGVITTILCCLVVLLTVLNLGQFITIRVIAKNQQVQLQQIQQQIVNRDRQVQQLIGKLKASKTIDDVKEVLKTVE